MLLIQDIFLVITNGMHIVGTEGHRLLEVLGHPMLPQGDSLEVLDMVVRQMGTVENVFSYLVRVQITKLPTEAMAGMVVGQGLEPSLAKEEVVLLIPTQRFVPKSPTCKVLMQILLDGLLFLWFRRIL